MWIQENFKMAVGDAVANLLEPMRSVTKRLEKTKNILIRLFVQMMRKRIISLIRHFVRLRRRLDLQMG